MLPRRKILVVDDDKGTQEVLYLILSQAGFEVTRQDNAEAILRDLSAEPDIILLDNQLPDISGAALCILLKKNLSTRHIPVILASGIEDLETLANHSGADDFIVKPFGINQLLQKIDILLKPSCTNQKV